MNQVYIVSIERIGVLSVHATLEGAKESLPMVGRWREHLDEEHDEMWWEGSKHLDETPDWDHFIDLMDVEG